MLDKFAWSSIIKLRIRLMKEIDLRVRKITTHNLRKVLPIYMENKTRLVALCVCFIMTGVLGVLTPIFSANALASLAETKFDTAIRCAVILAVLSLFRLIFNYITERVYIKFNARIKFKLTNMLVCAVNQTKMSKLDETKLGAISERLGGDVYTVSSTYLDIIDMIFDIITNAVFFIYIATLNFLMFLILLAYVLILYVICAYKSRVWVRGRKYMREINDKARSSYYEQISGVRDVKLLNIKDNITEYSNNLHKEALKFDVKFSNQRNFLRRVQGLISALFATTFMILGIVFVNKDFLLLTGFLVIYSYRRPAGSFLIRVVKR